MSTANNKQYPMAGNCVKKIYYFYQTLATMQKKTNISSSIFFLTLLLLILRQFSNGQTADSCLKTKSIFRQEIEITSSYNSSSNPLFQNALGFGLHYFIRLNSLIKLGIEVNQYFNSHLVIGVGETINGGGTTYYFFQDNCTVKQTSIRLNSLFTLRQNKHLYIGIGPDLSYNVPSGKVNALYTYQNFDSFQYTGNIDKQAHNIGLGLLARIEIKKIFIPRMSFCITIRPQYIRGGQFPLSDGTTNVSFLGKYFITEFQIGLKYNFNKIK